MKFKKKHFFLFFVLINLFISCEKNQTKKQKIAYYIDLSVQQKSTISSFKIEPNGKGIVLINGMSGIDSIYQVQFNKKEIDNITKKINELSLTKCDTIDKNYSDGMRYIMIINDNKQNKKTLISGTCKQLETLDNLVLYIMNIYDKKEKSLFYESLKIITPPPFPENFKMEKDNKN
ncbi:hypothetical protein [Flavobacterium hydatis]|jgi:hypothetical protein|uniref:Lipoprotein n=1 Tax=Flavobacterium hydatis TaxID=991 RepID=A0A086AIQ5_FLAHY|nr:hypothetical protein [Flavobacterium hydatis]KFF16569.1 hypothetical protein IW20_10400 [Flavobacterium hydatis]OXA90227.1 hypothetical protein B0A62_19330 [Flavobacterium hydatis]